MSRKSCRSARRWLGWSAIALACLCLLRPALGQQASSDLPALPEFAAGGYDDLPAAEANEPNPLEGGGWFEGGPETWFGPEGFSSTLQIMLSTLR